MAVHSSVLACRIPWTEEPGGLQSMGSQSQTQLKRPSISFLGPGIDDEATCLILGEFSLKMTLTTWHLQ